jgi:hypothetical protein
VADALLGSWRYSGITFWSVIEINGRNARKMKRREDEFQVGGSQPIQFIGSQKVFDILLQTGL